MQDNMYMYVILAKMTDYTVYTVIHMAGQVGLKNVSNVHSKDEIHETKDG